MKKIAEGKKELFGGQREEGRPEKGETEAVF